jgi:hypothetical protein
MNIGILFTLTKASRMKMPTHSTGLLRCQSLNGYTKVIVRPSFAPQLYQSDISGSPRHTLNPLHHNSPNLFSWGFLLLRPPRLHSGGDSGPSLRGKVALLLGCGRCALRSAGTALYFGSVQKGSRLVQPGDFSVEFCKDLLYCHSRSLPRRASVVISPAVPGGLRQSGNLCGCPGVL